MVLRSILQKDRLLSHRNSIVHDGSDPAVQVAAYQRSR